MGFQSAVTGQASISLNPFLVKPSLPRISSSRSCPSTHRSQSRWRFREEQSTWPVLRVQTAVPVQSLLNHPYCVLYCNHVKAKLLLLFTGRFFFLAKVSRILVPLSVIKEDETSTRCTRLIKNPNAHTCHSQKNSHRTE